MILFKVDWDSCGLIRHNSRYSSPTGLGFEGVCWNLPPKHICTRNFRSFPLSLASFNRWMSANWAALTSVGSITMGFLSCSSSNTSVSSVYCISPSRIPTFRDSESLGCSRNCSRISTRFVFSGRNLIVRGRIPRSTGLNKESCVLLCCFMLCFYVVMSMS